MAGYVYVIENENHKVKIGRSINPEKRIACIQGQSGYKIINVYITPKLHQYDKFELFLHDVFSDNRDIGEWFNIGHHDVVNYISTLDLSKWNVGPPYYEPIDFKLMVEELMVEPSLQKDKETCANDEERFIATKEKISILEEYICEKNLIIKKYIDNLYDQIDTLQSKLIYLQEQGVQVKFPKLPQYDEDAIILAREDIMEEYNSIE